MDDIAWIFTWLKDKTSFISISVDLTILGKGKMASKFLIALICWTILLSLTTEIEGRRCRPMHRQKRCIDWGSKRLGSGGIGRCGSIGGTCLLVPSKHVRCFCLRSGRIVA